MKKLSSALAITTFLIGSAHADIDFQKVYKLPGLSAIEIKEAFGTNVIDVGQDAMQTFNDITNITTGNKWKSDLSGLKKIGNVRCNISVSSWLPDVNAWHTANVNVQSKNEKVRITVSDLVIYGPGKKTCVISIEKYLDKKLASIKLLDNNW